MIQIALTGGIASGKSVVGNRLVELGAVLIDADTIAREVVRPGTPGLARIVDEFGAGVLAADGTLDRPALAAIVFADPARRAALNAITHPLIDARARELVAVAPKDAVVVHDIPLLAEGTRKGEGFDLVVVVHAPVETRLRRMINDRGMTRQEAQQRIDAQASDADRLALADVVIENDGELADTLRQVDELWANLQRKRDAV
jgi:dephospho-CoA kinase